MATGMEDLGFSLCSSVFNQQTWKQVTSNRYENKDGKTQFTWLNGQ